MERTMTVEPAALAAERHGMLERIIALEGVSFAARMGRKTNPQKLEQLRSEIQTLRSNVRLLDQAIEQSDAA